MKLKRYLDWLTEDVKKPLSEQWLLYIVVLPVLLGGIPTALFIGVNQGLAKGDWENLVRFLAGGGVIYYANVYWKFFLRLRTHWQNAKAKKELEGR